MRGLLPRLHVAGLLALVNKVLSTCSLRNESGE